MGTDGGVSFSASGFDNALAEVGLNTGNLMFQFAVWRQVLNPKVVVAPGHSPEPVREMADLLVIPAANQVNPAWDMGAWADFVEACDLPVLCIGLGAQSQIDGDPRLELQPGTERFVHAVAERSTTIGVRGTFTQKVLAHLGVTNTIVTGCPSQTINPAVTGAKVQTALDAFASISRPNIGYVLGTFEEPARKAEGHLAKLIRRYDHDLILQTDKRFLRLAFEGASAAESPDFLKWFGHVMRPDLSKSGFIEYVADHGRFYSDARSWIDRMRRHDLVIGMRIHGAVAAIQAERAGVCVAFDSRTLELAGTMGIPSIRADEIQANMSLRDIVEMTTFDAARFDQVRAVNTQAIRKLMAEAGCRLIPH